MLRLQTLGHLDLRGPDGSDLLRDVGLSKSIALLAYLALDARGGFHRRDTLVALLWPELDQSHARAALRKAIHHLRALVPDLFVSRSDEELRLAPEALWCDAAELVRLAPDAPAEALSHYQGDLLLGFHVPEAPEFDRWLDESRHRLRTTATDCAMRLTETARVEAARREAVQWARRAAEISPLEEGPNRLLIETLEEAGDRSAALTAFDRFTARLKNELDVEPGEATRRYVASLRAGAPAPELEAEISQVSVSPTVPAAAIPPSRTNRPPLILGFRPVHIVVTGLALLVAVSLLLIRPLRTGRAQPSESPTIAVLAFNNLGGDPANEPFSDGIADELTTALGKVEGLSVAARTSAFSFKNKGLSAREIGTRLQVRYVVEGAVRQSGQRRRVSAQLIDVTRDKEVWSGFYEHDIRNADVFSLQDSITGAIVRELRVKLTPGTTTRLAAHATSNPEAYELYLQGRYFFARRDLVSLARAREYFERAIAMDSSYALAYAGLSEAYSHSSVFGGIAPHDAFSKAKVAVRRALELDSTLVEAHTSLGFIALFYDWDFPAAGRAFDRALALDPRYPPARLFRAWYYVGLNKMEEAVEEFRAAVRLEPFVLTTNGRLATGLSLARRWDEAMAQARRTLDLEPTSFQGHSELGIALLGLGRCSEAVSELQQMGQTQGALVRGLLGYAYAKCGQRDRALAELHRLEEEARAGRYVTHFSLANIHAGLGNRDKAFAELTLALEERAWSMFYLESNPFFDDLRSDPRFEQIVKQVGPPAARAR